MEEVLESVAAIREAGNEQIVVLQCTGSYPAPLDSLNLRAIQTLQEKLGVLTGLSDHSLDPIVGPLGAVALGARVIEKHFTLDKNLPGPDHRFALEPDELKTMIARIRELEMALGSGLKEVQQAELELRSFARRSIFAVREIRPGDAFTKENVAVLRCGKLRAGLEPKFLPHVLGRRARRHISAETAIVHEDYE